MGSDSKAGTEARQTVRVTAEGMRIAISLSARHRAKPLLAAIVAPFVKTFNQHLKEGQRPLTVEALAAFKVDGFVVHPAGALLSMAVIVPPSASHVELFFSRQPAVPPPSPSIASEDSSPASSEGEGRVVVVPLSNVRARDSTSRAPSSSRLSRSSGGSHRRRAVVERLVNSGPHALRREQVLRSLQPEGEVVATAVGRLTVELASTEARALLRLQAVVRGCLARWGFRRARMMVVRLQRWVRAVGVQPHERPFVALLLRQIDWIVVIQTAYIATLATVDSFAFTSPIAHLHGAAMVPFVPAVLIGSGVLRLGGGRRPAYLTLRAMATSRLLHSVLLLAHQSWNPAEAVLEATVFSRCLFATSIVIASIMGLLPSPSDRTSVGYVCFFIGLHAVVCVRYALLAQDSIVMWVLRGPVAFALSGLGSRVARWKALERTVEREETLGDLRLAIDGGSRMMRLVDTAAVAREWERGPLVLINAIAMMIGLFVFLVVHTLATHGLAGEPTLPADDASLFGYWQTDDFLRLAPLLCFSFWALEPWFPKGMSYHWARLLGHLIPLDQLLRVASTVRAISLLCADPPAGGACEPRTAAGSFLSRTLAALIQYGIVPRADERPIFSLSGLLPLEPLLDILRGFIVATLPVSPHLRMVNMVLMVASRLVRDIHRALRMDLEREPVAYVLLHGFSMTLFGIFTAYLAVHEATGSSWQRERTVVQLEIARRKQLHQSAIRSLRALVAREQPNVLDLADLRAGQHGQMSGVTLSAAPSVKSRGSTRSSSRRSRSSRHSYASSMHSIRSLASISEDSALLT